MSEKKCKKCKYCGQKARNGDVCSDCWEKLKLVRKLLAMVKAAKEEGGGKDG